MEETHFDEYIINAPMYSDFGDANDVSDDYFNFSHPENATPLCDAPEKLRGSERKFDPSVVIYNVQKSTHNSTSTSQLSANFMETLDTINMTPIKVVSPTNKKGHCVILKETTVGKVLNDVIGIASSMGKQKRKTLGKLQTVGPESTSATPKRTTRSMSLAKVNSKTPAAKAVANLRKSTAQRATPVKLSNTTDDSAKNHAGVPMSKIIRTPILKLTRIDSIVESHAITRIDNVEDLQTADEVDQDETIKPDAEIIQSALNSLPQKPKRALLASTPALKPVLFIPLNSETNSASSSPVSSPKNPRPDRVPPTLSPEPRSQNPEPNAVDIEESEEENEYNDHDFQPTEDFHNYQVQKARFVETRATNSKRRTVLTSLARRRSSIMNRRHSNRYVSLAEAVIKFQRGTPTRFRSVSSKNPGPRCVQNVKQQARKLVTPVSPVLLSKNRVRRNVVLSRAELEEIEIQKMKQHKIRANPLPKSIRQGPQLPKTVPKNPVTAVQQVQLGISKKLVPKAKEQPIPSTASAPEPSVSFKKPMTKIVPTVVSSSENGVTISETTIMHFGIPAQLNSQLGSARKKHTQLQPFNFEQRTKLFMSKKEEKLKKLQTEEKLKTKSEFHARPMPSNLKKAPMKELARSKEDNTKDRQELKPRVIPFSFEERNKMMLEKKEQLRKKIEEEEKKARIFHANPAPQFKPVMCKGTSRENLKHEEKKPLTIVSRSRSRDNIKIDKNNPPKIRMRSAEPKKTPLVPTNRESPSGHSKIIRGHSADNLKVTSLRRKSSTSEFPDYDNTNDENVAPNNHQADCKLRNTAKSNMPLLKPNLKNFELHSDKRARLRREYDEQIKLKNTLAMDKRRREEAEKLAREQAEINELRKKATIKARPMPVYKPMSIIKSTKPLTTAESPAWSHKR